MSLDANFDFKSSAEMVSMVSNSLPAFFQDLKLPSRYPRVLSKPTRAKRVIVSSSRPSGVTGNKGCSTSAIRAPTHGAKLPSKPMKIERGMCPFTKSS